MRRVSKSASADPCSCTHPYLTEIGWVVGRLGKVLHSFWRAQNNLAMVKILCLGITTFWTSFIQDSGQTSQILQTKPTPLAIGRFPHTPHPPKQIGWLKLQDPFASKPHPTPTTPPTRPSNPLNFSFLVEIKLGFPLNPQKVIHFLQPPPHPHRTPPSRSELRAPLRGLQKTAMAVRARSRSSWSWWAMAFVAFLALLGAAAGPRSARADPDRMRGGERIRIGSGGAS